MSNVVAAHEETQTLVPTWGNIVSNQSTVSLVPAICLESLTNRQMVCCVLRSNISVSLFCLWSCCHLVNMFHPLQCLNSSWVTTEFHYYKKYKVGLRLISMIFLRSCSLTFTPKKLSWCRWCKRMFYSGRANLRLYLHKNTITTL